jgi:epoxyqueuosine reductase
VVGVGSPAAHPNHKNPYPVLSLSYNLPMSLEREIKAEAGRLGFQLVGITTPDPPPHYSVFEAWLGAGLHGEMGYLGREQARQRREDPRRILPECRSILVLGMRYGGGGESSGKPEPGRKTGRIAAYARQEDYHLVFPEKLRALVAFLEAKVGRPVPNRWYTDTGPVLERDLAQRAGLGWIGKNTCLINPDQGSYLLLAEILLGIELELDPSFLPDRCGSCTRCLDACPTQCILPDRTIDARRCISYFTIELKGPIPTGLRPLAGDWVFGCDICQEVCPWNSRSAAGDLDRRDDRPAETRGEGAHEAASAAKGEGDFPAWVDLAAGLSLTPEEFNRRFKGSPVKRARRRGYLRNLAVALGNQAAESGDPQAVGALARSLQDPEPLVRGHSAWALGRIGGDAAREALLEAAVQETDLYVLAEIQAALDGRGEPGGWEPETERPGEPQ